MEIVVLTCLVICITRIRMLTVFVNKNNSRTNQEFQLSNVFQEFEKKLWKIKKKHLSSQIIFFF